MRTMMSGAAALAAAFALSLFSPLANAAGATILCVSEDRAPPTLPSSGQLLDQMEGHYQLSNGQRVKLHRVQERLWIEFRPRRDVALERIGENRFTSRDGSVDLSYQPDSQQISMRYPTDGRGHFVRAC